MLLVHTFVVDVVASFERDVYEPRRLVLVLP